MNVVGLLKFDISLTYQKFTGNLRMVWVRLVAPWMQRVDDWFHVLSSRPGSSDAEGYSELDSRDTQETVVPQSLAGAMPVRALGPSRRDPSSRSACS